MWSKPQVLWRNRIIRTGSFKNSGTWCKTIYIYIYIVPNTIRDTRPKIFWEKNCCVILAMLIVFMKCSMGTINHYLTFCEKTVSKDLSEVHITAILKICPLLYPKMAIGHNKGPEINFFYTFTKSLDRPVLTYCEKISTLESSQAKILGCPLLCGGCSIRDIQNLMIES